MNLTRLRQYILGGLVYGPLLFVAVYVLFLFTLTWFLDFNEIVEWNRARVPYFHKLNPAQDLPFTEVRYTIARYLTVFLWAVFIVLISAGFRYHAYLTKQVRVMGATVEDEIRRCTLTLQRMPRQGIWLIATLSVFSLLVRLWQYEFVFLHNDELATYNYFVRHGWPLTMVYYPMSNNHVFFNVLFVATSSVISDYVLAGRIISLVSFYLAVFVLFTGLIRISASVWSGVIALMLTLFLMPPSIYSVIGRGYMLSILLGLIAGLALLRALNTNNRECLFLFVIAGILGCYTMPVFILILIPLVVCFVWYAVAHNVFREWLWKIILLFVLGNLLVYLPVIVFNGPETFFLNKDFTQKIQAGFWEVYQIHVAEILSYLSAVASKGWLIFILILLIALFSGSGISRLEKQFMFVSLFITGTFLLFPLVTGGALPMRVISLVTFLWYGFIAIALGRIAHVLPVKYALVISGVLLLLIARQSWQQHRNDPFTHILPDASKRVLRTQFEDCMVDDCSVYLCTSSEYVQQVVDYMAQKGLKVTDNLEAASLMVIDSARRDEYTYDQWYPFMGDVILRKDDR